MLGIVQFAMAVSRQLITFTLCNVLCVCEWGEEQLITSTLYNVQCWGGWQLQLMQCLAWGLSQDYHAGKKHSSNVTSSMASEVTKGKLCQKPSFIYKK